MTAVQSPLAFEPLVLVFQDPQPGGQDAPPVVRRGDTPPGGGAERDGTVQGDRQQQPGMQDQCMSTLPMLLGFVAIFYFLILRPQQKSERKRKEMLAAIKKGDRVATNGGLHGVITAIDNETVTLQVDQNVKIKFDRAAVARVVASDGATAGEST